MAGRHGLSTATPRGDPTARRKTKPLGLPAPRGPEPLKPLEPQASEPRVPDALAPPLGAPFQPAAVAHWQLTGARQGRGRCYDAMAAFDCPTLVGAGGSGGGVAQALSALAADAATLAQGLPLYGGGRALPKRASPR